MAVVCQYMVVPMAAYGLQCAYGYVWFGKGLVFPTGGVVDVGGQIPALQPCQKITGRGGNDLSVPIQVYNPVPNADAAMLGDIQREMAIYRCTRRQRGKHVAFRYATVHAFVPIKYFRRHFKCLFHYVV